MRAGVARAETVEAVEDQEEYSMFLNIIYQVHQLQFQLAVVAQEAVT